jgi:hypothetical protein
MNRSIVIALALATVSVLVPPSACADASEPNLLPVIDSPKGFDQSKLVTSALPDGRIVDILNSDEGKAPSAFVYLSAKNRWQALDSVDGVERLVGPLVTLANDQVWALGEDAHDHRLVAKTLDLRSGHWRDSAPPPQEVSDPWRRVVRLTDERLLVLGSRSGSVGWVYDAVKDHWSKTSEIPGTHDGVMFATSLEGGKAFVFPNPPKPATQGWVSLVYESGRDVWHVSEPLHEAAGITPDGFLKLADGSMLLISLASRSAQVFTVLFHPDALTWQGADRLGLSPGTYTLRGLFLLQDGNVVLLSNAIPGSAQSSLFDPATLRWSAYGTLPVDTPNAQVQGLLPNGDVWAIGYGVKGQWSELVHSATTGQWTAARSLPTDAVLVSPANGSSRNVLLYIGRRAGRAVVVDESMLFRP